MQKMAKMFFFSKINLVTAFDSQDNIQIEYT